MLTASELAARKELPAPATRRALRMAAGLSRAELAEIVGCSESAIVTYELGTRTPRAGTRLNYAEALRDLKQYLADAG